MQTEKPPVTHAPVKKAVSDLRLWNMDSESHNIPVMLGDECYEYNR